MHLSIMLIAVGLAILVRLFWSKFQGTWADRWQQTLGGFLFPPLLLLMTSITVLKMGHHGMMLWQPVGWLGCHLALGFLGIAGGLLAYLLWRQWRFLQQVRSYQLTKISNRTGRILETPALFAAQVGIWKPELLISQGLLQSLDAMQIEAVLNHEEAHNYYRDTFWFFWLNWIRLLSCWLPKTEVLWQELLLLRELRADHWASQRVDSLLLAESLLFVAKSSLVIPNHDFAAFYGATPGTRLEERIEFLITQSEVSTDQYQLWLWLVPVFIPVLIIPFHI